jgi:hypothetical protein
MMRSIFVMKVGHPSNPTIEIPFWKFGFLSTAVQKPAIDTKSAASSFVYVSKGVDLGRDQGAAILLALSLLIFATQCRGGQAITIGFEGPPIQPPGTGRVITNYAETGVMFEGFFDLAGSGRADWPNNGTTYIQANVPAVTCRRFDKLSFRLVSVDLAGFNTSYPDFSATFEGVRSDGSVVTTNFSGSGIAFQSFNFSSNFTDVTNVLITADALDNLKMEVAAPPPDLHVRINSYNHTSWLTFSVHGTVGIHYRLEYTDVLSATNWTAFTNFVSSFAWSIDLPVTNPPQRFFRAVELP